MVDFNPRSHEGSDSEDRINIYQVNISIHAPTRGATPVSTPIPGIHCIFQSTLPRGERLPKPRRSTQNGIFQSTLPRGERRSSISSKHLHSHFNPRSHEGSDDERARARQLLDNFNPRSHEGSDADPQAEAHGSIEISIHAPTRGATLQAPLWEQVTIISIHAPTRGATMYISVPIVATRFQSTLPRGERPEARSSALS